VSIDRTYGARLVGRRRSTALDPPLLVLELHPLLVQRVLHLLVTRVKLLFGNLELALLFLDFLLEDHLHLGFHLGKLGLSA
jgi:hypothetical protein